MKAIWATMNPREKFLALTTGTLALCFLLALIGLRVSSRLDQLNGRIVQLEQELHNLTEQEAMSLSAVEKFSEMASEHSSTWTEEEIRDRLLREIYRLALHNPPPPETDMTEMTFTPGDYMVKIPELRKGTLNSEGQGYREYLIELRLLPANLENVLAFMERLQTSRQSLRIDSVNLARGASGTKIDANFTITRTIVDTHGEAGDEGAPPPLVAENLISNPGFEEWSPEGVATGWNAAGATLLPADTFRTEGSRCLKAALASTGQAAALYQQHDLVSGRVYRLALDVIAQTPVTVAIDEPDGKQYQGETAEVPGDNRPHRVELRFRADDQPVRAPLVQWTGDGDVYLDNVQLTDDKD
ncbi:MAG: hypothetical protein WD873_05340 [Candidatus Hydrogenedentales bacterium]